MAYLNTEQAAFRYGFVKREVGPDGRVTEVADRLKVREHIRRHKVPTFYCGRSMRVREIDFENSMRPGPHARPQPRSARRFAS